MDIDLADALRALNRRERFLVVGWALDRLTFQIGWEFRSGLRVVLQEGRFELDVPADAFIAMDYPMLWVEAALDWSFGEMRLQQPIPLDALGRAVRSTSFEQHGQDADLLIAFPSGAAYDLVFVEAKGVTSWDYDQMASKLVRIQSMSQVYPDSVLRPHFVAIAPVPPGRKELERHLRKIGASMPDWVPSPDGEIRWLKLPQPLARRVRATRGKVDSTEWWLEEEPWPS